jgi:hypothetical protein
MVWEVRHCVGIRISAYFGFPMEFGFPVLFGTGVAAARISVGFDATLQSL